MAPRFTLFWKQLIPPSSEFDAPFEKAHYRSLFLSEPFLNKLASCQEEELVEVCVKKRSRRTALENGSFEDAAG